MEGLCMLWWLPTTIGIVVSILIAVVVVVANFNNRFSSTAWEAKYGTQMFALRILNFIFIILLMGNLIIEMLSSAPLTRMAVFNIAFSVSMILCTIIMLRMTASKKSE
jgi:hypothetical protein